MQMRRCLILLTDFADAFQEFTKFCDNKACWRGAGVLTRTKICLRARRKRLIEYARLILSCRMTNSFTRTLTSGCADLCSLLRDMTQLPRLYEFGGQLR